MRTSQAALALITQVNSQGETEYLTQWNNAWQAYSLVGGHAEEGETFQQCCIREVAEELECDEHTVMAAPYPCATLRFCEFSRAAKVETGYHWQVFIVRVSNSTLQQLPTDCRWVGADQIRASFTTDGKPIAEQVWRVLQAIESAELVCSPITVMLTTKTAHEH